VLEVFLSGPFAQYFFWPEHRGTGYNAQIAQLSTVPGWSDAVLAKRQRQG